MNCLIFVDYWSDMFRLLNLWTNKHILDEYCVVECYCTCILEILRYFFILQSLTTSKMRKFQTLKLSQFHKEKTCWTQNWWSSGIMSNFWEEFFYVLGAKKNSKIFFKNILATALKSYIKRLLYFILFWKSWKTGIIPSKYSLRTTSLHPLWYIHTK